MSIVILIELIIYFVAMLLIGVYFSRKELGYDDYHLGGNKLSGWVLAFSERSTEASAWLLLGATGFAFSTGLSSIWLFIGMLGGIIVSWLFLAKKFMEERIKYNVLTLPDYLSARFPKHGNLIRAIGALIIIPFFTFYVGAQFGGAGNTLEQTMGIQSLTGILVIAAVVIIYACLGGFLSVVWTDAIQAILMVLTLVVLPIVALFKIGVEDLSIIDALVQAGNGVNSWTGGVTGFAVGILIYTNLSWAFGFLGGQPHISARFMALRSEKDVKTGRNVAITWGVLAYGGSFLIGITGITLYGSGNVENVEMILPIMLTDLLPVWLVGILLSGILAAIMSTASSQLLVVTSSISEDVLHKIMGLKLTEKQFVVISRITVIIVGIIGLIFGLMSKSLIYVVVGWAWAGVGNSFGAAVLLTFFWKRVSGAGIIAALLTGSISTIIWISTPLEDIFTSRGATLVLALLAGVIISLAIPDKKDFSTEKEEGIKTI
ncbi:sodium:proline symporter [Pueribacillus theae]|uniref:Sodium/proline symporter n=1 Tax=Pueribacillus theae TaxID=2171751 RepID=A0A2U1JRV5_9BACI|nr:sodium/proline symporter [Pueribacillus theae]PWA07603.1 sodium:proline symporter [Pueribacillus theae]